MSFSSKGRPTNTQAIMFGKIIEIKMGGPSNSKCSKSKKEYKVQFLAQSETHPNMYRYITSPVTDGSDHAQAKDMLVLVNDGEPQIQRVDNSLFILIPSMVKTLAMELLGSN